MRVPSIDLLRGLVMVLMVIDHAREYSAGPGRVADPMDLSQTSPLLFTLRWISHFCAPVFALLMGVSAGFKPDRRRLFTRGLWLILLEFTLIDWAWTFNPLWPRKFWQVIAALGASNVILSLLLPLGRPALLAIGLAIVGLHNLLDPISLPTNYLWALLHQKVVLPLPFGFEFRTTYPVLPIAGVVLCGFGIAPWFQRADAARRLAATGLSATALFLLLRTTNLYGDSSPFTGTLASLGNVTKYPLSLQFICMTLGPALLFLAATHNRRAPQFLVTLGRNPLPFYIGHLYLLHALALLWAFGQGHGPAPLSVRFGGIPEAFGFPLWQTIPFALFATVLLYTGITHAPAPVASLLHLSPPPRPNPAKTA
jgi:uncharacterized membrane protein